MYNTYIEEIRSFGENFELNLSCSLSTFYLIAGILFGSYLWYLLFWKPFEEYKDFSDYGFEDLKESHANLDDISKRNVINRVRAQQKAGELPPVYPNGWFAILQSKELQRGQVKEVNVLGLNLAAWRGESGKVYVSDAYCPHLGAHLAVGGKVCKECITCPFHGWSFDGTNGQLVNIPYSNSSKAEFANLKMRHVDEKNGLIFLWFHAEGEDPYWFVEVVPEVESGEWVYRGRTEFRVSCHIQEIQENTADLSHFAAVHEPIFESGQSGILGLVGKLFEWLGIRYSFEANWEALEGHKCILYLCNQQVVFHTKKIITVYERLKLFGPAVVHLEFDTSLGKAVIFITATPIGPQLLKFTHTLYSCRTVIHPLAKIGLYLETNMMERDMRVWNRKLYVHKPILPKEDVTIRKYRQWFKQFYTENSPRAYFTKEDVQPDMSF